MKIQWPVINVMRNKRGATMDPCGTPQVTCVKSEFKSFKFIVISNIISMPFVSQSIEAII